MDCHLLFPVGTHEKPPTEAFVADYDATLGQVLSRDGVLYYTEDTSVIRYRGELFEELLENNKLLIALKDFAAHFKRSEREGDTGSKLLRELTAYKSNMEAIRRLKDFFATQSFKSSAWNRIKKNLIETVESANWRKAVKAFEMLPEDFLQIKSITLGINLDPSGSAHEAGIVSLNPYYFVSDHPLEKLVRLGEQIHQTEPLLKPERGQENSWLEWNREVMRTVDRLLCKELKKLHIDYRILLNRKIGIGEDQLNELLFVLEFADMLMELRQCGSEIRYSSGDPSESRKATVHVQKTLNKIKLGYDVPMIADSEGVWKRTLAMFGVEVIIC